VVSQISKPKKKAKNKKAKNKKSKTKTLKPRTQKTLPSKDPIFKPSQTKPTTIASKARSYSLPQGVR
jgi:hypothetical protein